MTGATQVMMSGGGSSAVSGSATVASTTGGGATASCSIQLNAGGTIAYTGNGSTGIPFWWFPGTGAPAWWATNSINLGNAPNVSNPGPLVAISTNPTWAWSQAAIGSNTASCTLRVYADAAGTDLRGTINYTANATRSS